MRTQEEEDRSEIVALGIENLSIETSGVEEEAAQHLEAALGMEIDEYSEVEGEGEEGFDGNES